MLTALPFFTITSENKLTSHLLKLIVQLAELNPVFLKDKEKESAIKIPHFSVSVRVETLKPAIKDDYAD